jgi:hypothetical protein
MAVSVADPMTTAQQVASGTKPNFSCNPMLAACVFGRANRGG